MTSYVSCLTSSTGSPRVGQLLNEWSAALVMGEKSSESVGCLQLMCCRVTTSVRLPSQKPLYLLLFEWELVMSKWNVIPARPFPLCTDYRWGFFYPVLHVQEKCSIHMSLDVYNTWHCSRSCRRYKTSSLLTSSGCQLCILSRPYTSRI